MRLQRNELRCALEAWTYISGHGGGTEASLELALGWLRTLWETGHDHLPFDLVMDLGHLLVEGRSFPFASDVRINDWPEEERTWRLSYEDEVLGRWVLDPSVLEAQGLVASLEGEPRDAAIVHALGLALRSTDDGLSSGNPAFLRNADRLAKDLALSMLEDFPPVPHEWVVWARAQRAALLAKAKTRLFSEADLWELRHLDRLPQASTRLALRELRSSVEALGPMSENQRASLHRRAREVPVDQDSAEDFPVGGFDALSRRGRFENLVRSEMGFIGESAGDGPDLFDVRFAQGELLYYTRDENPLFDARVYWTFAFEEADELRHKHPQLPAQTLLLAQALGLRMQSDLLEVLGPGGVRTKFEWTANNEKVVEEERGLFAYLLADEVAAGRVQLDPAPSDQRDSSSKKGRTSLGRAHVRFVCSPRSRPTGAGATAWLRVGDPDWWLEDEALDARSWPGIRTIADRLLHRILEPQR